jgi:hypothetical protein
LYKNRSNRPKVVIYSSLFGNYEQIRELQVEYKDIDYFMFTDNPNLKSDHWKINVIEDSLQNPRRTSRLPKILPHKYLPNHDISIYMDANFQLLTDDIYQMIEQCLDGNDLALSKHKRRNCLYKELEHCVKVQKEKREIADRIKDKYLKNGFPSNWGLYLNGFIIRRNTDQIKQLNEMWWSEYSSGSERDQCSLMYCLWKLGIPVNPIDNKPEKEKRYYRIFRHSN